MLGVRVPLVGLMCRVDEVEDVADGIMLMEVRWEKYDARRCAFNLLVQPGRLGRGFELCMVNGWARGASQTEVVWPWHHDFSDV